MGFNTACIIRNDFLHDIEADREFGRKVYNAIISDGRGEYHGQSFDVLPSCHADGMQIVAVGGNCIRSLGHGLYRDNDEQLLRALADKLGYRIVRKSGGANVR